ncbi:MAG: type IV secretion system protein [Candidatus Phlomobacter fragariae]
MKKGLIILLMLIPSVSKGFTISVHDAISDLKRVSEWSETVEHYQNQIDAYKKQLATTTGIRQIEEFTSSLNNMKGELEKLYQEGDSFVADFTKNPTGKLNSKVMSLFKKYGAFDMCKSGIDTADNLCKVKVVSNAVNIEQGNKINKTLVSSMSQIDNLSRRIANAEDSKESQDLANALQAQSLKILAIKMQYDIWSNKNKADEAMFNKQQIAEYNKRQLNAPIPKFN